MQILVYEFWKKSSPGQAKESFQFLLNAPNLHDYLEILFEVDELVEYFCSYCWILREEDVLKDLINHHSMPVNLICKAVYYGFGKYIKTGNITPDYYFSIWAKIINSEKSLELLLREPLVEKDVTFQLNLLGNLNAKQWEEYFESTMSNSEDGNTESFLRIFEKIDPIHCKRLLYRNPNLYQYLRMLVVFDKQDSVPVFLFQLENNLKTIHRWEAYANAKLKEFSPKDERVKSPSRRNVNRLTDILKDGLYIADASDRLDFIEYLMIREVIVDEQEMEIVRQYVGLSDSSSNFDTKNFSILFSAVDLTKSKNEEFYLDYNSNVKPTLI
ncbi:LBF_1199 family protein [Leptospira bandrabouensis]|uniref:Uncharacterized protein n=1 Tax=Leptospira bandrabouensis TaxID=2484903 RepID=A0A6H3NSL7_9LEPT|nr:hypothetical protein [Leptospira bandrabouensis]MCG6152137.1 hypothetical protein [Leptospira bandrabouensis]MCW7457876.1 hypothetical protein [Leptospira bandrabouensis]MCW7477384.1 hypothetical protein [Leptospira bandrabouensis]MCW7485066.1 hypothetical protein [Leptospira bandrabouensis]TGN07251.1 hypothetical protein EHR07_03740 [Leptospira bandrabouensis]